MTEEEAKTKWCPFANGVVTTKTQTALAGNRVVGPDEAVNANPTYARCIGSACMAWRPGTLSKFRDGRTGRLLDRDLTGHGEWVMVGGYCGLAGSVQ